MLTPKQKSQVQQFTKYGRNFFLFCQDALGYKDMIEIHHELCDFLQHNPTPFKLILMPRYSFKSCIATIGYALWRLSLNDSLRVLIYSHSNAKAEGFLTELKNHIHGTKEHSIFRQLYGAWESDPKKGVWNQSAITIAVRQHAHAEPSVDTAGLETGKVGTHYDLIIFDDMVARENVTTPELIQKTKEVYRGALSLLRPGGEVLVVGTRWNFNDLYGALEAQRGHFATFIQKAEVDGGFPFERIGLTRDFLSHQKADQGSYLYSCLYQNDPVSEEEALFKKYLFTFYDPMLRSRPEWVQSLYITCCLDPATGEGEDLAALTVVGADTELNFYLLDLVSGKLLTSDQVHEMMALYARWNFRVLGIERNGFQQMICKDLEYRIEEERRRNPQFHLFHIEEFTSSSQNSKDMRIRGLQPYHERGAIRFPGTSVELLEGAWQRLAHQMLVYTPSHRPQHEDELDSLSFHPQIQHRGFERPQNEEFPWSSAKWFEREQYKKTLQERARLPRWTRPPLPQLAFS